LPPPGMPDKRSDRVMDMIGPATLSRHIPHQHEG
jgi:hypothetical protein